jgi:hypothetical protein
MLTAADPGMSPKGMWTRRSIAPGSAQAASTASADSR